MKPEQKPAPQQDAPATNLTANGPARRAWTVNFVVPQPKTMPSERMKARADLVRSALGCTSY